MNIDWQKYYDRVCPPLMKETDPNKLPVQALEKVLNYNPSSGIGLCLHGETGTGKTRCVWQLIKKLINEKEGDFFFVSSAQLGSKISNMFTDIKNSKEWFDIKHTCLVARTLILDDFGKDRFTDRVGSELFQIIDERSNKKKPIIYTTNYVGETLISKFADPNTGAPIVRRIRDFTKMISFVKE